MKPAYAGHLAMLAFSLLVAGSFALGVLSANDISPMALNAVRFWIAAGVIGATVLATTGMQRQALAAPWRYVVLAGFFTTYFVLMFEGLKTAPAVSAAAVFTLTPVLTALFGWLLLRQVLTRRMALALGVGAIGALWVIFEADFDALLRFEIGRGELIYFCGCISHAVYTPMVRKLHRGEPAIVYTFCTLLAGAMILTVLGWGDLRETDWASLPGIVWVTIGYTAVFASAATFTLLQFATLRLPSSKVMAYTYLTPSWVIAWGTALGGGTPAPAVLLGVGLTIIALLLLLKDEHPFTG
ncbi:DMT family transporter [Yoonia sp. BS5-3]|uniref:DMT family transporter n=1 Tax=Yoonia phaeophyticola TaxID=3137369 RepID=A0ABZ2V3Q6_9RHOB